MTTSERMGKESRENRERYFHVMGQGWYIFTREGTDGPYLNKDDAASVVNEFWGPVTENEDKGHAFWDDFFLK